MAKKATLNSLPQPQELQRRAQALAVLDAIMSPNWEYRYYMFNSKWAANEMMASTKNGSGDHLYILFSLHGAIMKGFDHESEMSPWSRDDQSLWPGLFEGVPSQFAEFVTEPSFEIPDTTFCIWRLNGDSEWHGGVVTFPDGEDSDGSEYFLSVFTSGPDCYKEFAQEYYEKQIPLRSVERIYSHEQLDKELVRSLNPELSLTDIETDLEEIGFGK